MNVFLGNEHDRRIPWGGETRNANHSIDIPRVTQLDEAGVKIRCVIKLLCKNKIDVDGTGNYRSLITLNTALIILAKTLSGCPL